MPSKGLLERLRDNEYVICAEGYLFEFERRGYLQAGAFVPEVVIEHPDLVEKLHEEFVHAGSDVVEAFTYYGHRAKMQIIEREDEVEKLNRQALKIARRVADRTGTLMAGNISNTTVFVPNNKEAADRVHGIFKEQIEWAVSEGADFIVGETYAALEEALIAVDCIKKYGNGLPSVITMRLHTTDFTYDGVPIGEACRKLEEAGADVVGLNCFRGPRTIITAMKEVRAACKGFLACLPVPYRTTESAPAMSDLKDVYTGEPAFPLDLDPWLCSRKDVEDFTKACMELDIKYVGLCCGNRSCYLRTLAETLGRHPPASRYTADMSRHMSRIKGDKYNYDVEKWAKEHGGDHEKAHEHGDHNK